MVRFLPNSKGKYGVGVADVINKYGKDRTLFRLFYPIPKESYKMEEAIGLMEDFNYVRGICQFFGMPRLASFVNWCISDVRVPVNVNSAPITGNNRFPVAVFSHGLGGNRIIYNTVCCEMASQGMVVAAVEHADESASATYYLDPENKHKKWIDYLPGVNKLANEWEVRNRQVRQRAIECSEALNCLEAINSGTLDTVDTGGFNLQQLFNRLDLEQGAAIVGHSFGGATALCALADDRRFTMAVGLDVWTFPLEKDIYRQLHSSTCKKPILMINMFHFHWVENIANLRKLDGNNRAMVTIKGTVHQNQSDSPYFFGAAIPTPLQRLIKLRGELDHREATRINNELMMAFINQHLIGGAECESNKVLADVIADNSKHAFIGSNIKIDEDRLAQSQQKIAT